MEGVFSLTISQNALMIFNSEERSYLNSLSMGISLADLTRTRVLEILAFAATAVDANDVLAVELVSDLNSKMSDLPDDVWNSLKTVLPFAVSYDSPDEDSPVDS
jgi:hypothetical protein